VSRNALAMIAMSTQVVQAVLVVVAALVFAVAVTVVFRRTLVSFRYWLGWLTVSAVLVAAGVVLAVVPEDSRVGGLSPLTLSMVFFLLINLLIAVQLSISISGQARMISALAQDVTDLRRRIEAGEEAAGLIDQDAAPSA